MAGRTLFDKLWEPHVVAQEGGQSLLYVDRHILHDLKFHAFNSLADRGLKVRRPEATFGVIDHAVPTEGQTAPLADREAAEAVAQMRRNAATHGYRMFDLGEPANGITHVVGPEQGITQPGLTLVCGDSHTATHGAFGALAFGIGNSEVVHVLATQTLWQRKPARMRVSLEGTPGPGIYGKDLVLALIGRIGIGGGTGHVIEYAGEAVRALSMEARMTVCNMTIEAGARAGMVAPDETTFAYLQGRPYAPQGAAWEEAVAYWRTLPSDPDAAFDREVSLDVTGLAPRVTWGTTPGMVTGIDGTVPDPADAPDADTANAWRRALAYMGLQPGTRLQDVAVDAVFIGSCTNSRIEDLREAARYVQGRRVADGVRALVVPGSGLVRAQAEAEGLHRVFTEAGFAWREPGCSMCIAMNGDALAPGERCASTSNRNFEGRQGEGGRTHLMSPAMAAVTALYGRLTDVREVAPAAEA